MVFKAIITIEWNGWLPPSPMSFAFRMSPLEVDPDIFFMFLRSPLGIGPEISFSVVGDTALSLF